MAVGSKTEFIECLRRSQVISAEKIAELEQEYESIDLSELVRQLVKTNVLTSWQAKFLYSGRHQLKLANYVLLERIQRDELGDRFLARNIALNRQVEIQILPSEVAKDAQLQNLFISHASVISELDHPHLSHIQDVDKSGGRYYLIDEQRAGDSLDQIQLTSNELVYCTNQILQALAFAHSHGVSHGEVVDKNIVRTGINHFKICGIGLPFLRKQLAGAEPTNARDDMLTFSSLMQSKLERLDPADQQELSWLEDNLKQLLNDPMGAYPHVVVATEQAISRMASQATNGVDPAVQKDSIDSLASPDLLAEAPTPPPVAAPQPNPTKKPSKPKSTNRNTQKSKPAVNPVMIGAIGLVSLGVLVAAILFATGAFSGQTASNDGDDHSSAPPSTHVSDSTTQKKPNRPSNKQPEPKVEKQSDPTRSETDPSKNEKDPPKPDAEIVRNNPEEQQQKDPAKSTNTPDENTEEKKPSGNAPRKFNSADIAAALAETQGAKGEKAITLDSNPTKDGTHSTTSKSTNSSNPSTNSDDTPRTAVVGEGFTGFDSTFDLAGTDSKEPMTIGQLSDEETLSGLKLIYDISAFQSGKGGFILKPVDDTSWELQLLVRQDKTEGPVVGKFEVADGTLQFTWNEKVSKHSPANALRNCILEISSGEVAKEIALRVPVEFDLQLTEEAYRQKIKTGAEWMPQAAFIGVEIERPENPWPKRVYIEDGEEFPETFHFDNQLSPLKIYFDRTISQQYLSVVIQPVVEKSLFFQVGVFGRGKKTDPVEFENYEGLNRAVDLIEKAKLAKGVQAEQAKIAADNAPYGQRGKTRDFADDVRREFETLKDNFDISTDIREQLEDIHGGKLKFNVYYQLDGRRVIIARSSDY